MPFAWVLNLDADLELRRPRGYTPSSKVQARMARFADQARQLCGPGDVVVAEPTAALAGYHGMTWCPTPRALGLLRAVQATPPTVPALEVLRRVNHRAFAAELGPWLDGAEFVRQAERVEELLRSPAATGFWLLKRPLGLSGLGRRRVPAGVFGAADRAWVEASLRDDGLQVEPWVERAADYAIHGFLGRHGSCVWGEPCRQSCSEQGVWQGSARCAPGDLEPGEHHLLMAAAERAADALRRAGYFGPFGIDAFRYRRGSGLDFNPLSEINARYTMGWVVGMGSARPDRET
jgi:hypothetical protein